jgi:DnaJ-class molecular chaperone
MLKTCVKCKGIGWIEDQNYGIDCPQCSGTGTIKVKRFGKKTLKPSKIDHRNPWND